MFLIALVLISLFNRSQCSMLYMDFGMGSRYVKMHLA